MEAPETGSNKAAAAKDKMISKPDGRPTGPPNGLRFFARHRRRLRRELNAASHAVTDRISAFLASAPGDAASKPDLPCCAGTHRVASTKVPCLEKAVCTIDDNHSALHKNGNGMGAGVDLTLSQPRLPNLLDRVVGVTTGFGALFVSRRNLAESAAGRRTRLLERQIRGVASRG